MGKKSGSVFRIRIRDGKPGSYFWELRNHFFGLKYLQCFYADPASRIRDGKNLDSGSGMERILIQDPRCKKSDPGSWINIPDQQNWESSRQNLLGLKEPNNNQTLCGKAIWDETKSFLQSKPTSVALKRRKTPVNWIFKSPTWHGRHCQTTSSRGENVTAAYLHKDLAKI